MRGSCHPPLSLAAAAVSGIAAVAFLTATVAAQVSTFGMIKQCPEGCRPIDFVTSCGSVNATASCNVSVSGTVTLTCQGGPTYQLGVRGCRTIDHGDHGAFSTAWVIAQSKEVAQVVGDAYVQHLYLCCAVLAALSAYFATVGYALPRATVMLIAAITGGFVGVVVAVCTGVAPLTDDSDSSLAWLWTTIGACAIFTDVIACMHRRAAGAVVGLCCGALLATTGSVFATYFLEAATSELWIPALIGGSALALACAGACFPRGAILITSVLLACVGTMNAVAGFVSSGPLLAGARDDSHRLVVPLTSAAAATAVGAVMQLVWWVRRARRKELAQRELVSDSFDGFGSYRVGAGGHGSRAVNYYGATSFTADEEERTYMMMHGR